MIRLSLVFLLLTTFFFSYSLTLYYVACPVKIYNAFISDVSPAGTYSDQNQLYNLTVVYEYGHFSGFTKILNQDLTITPRQIGDIITVYINRLVPSFADIEKINGDYFAANLCLFLSLVFLISIFVARRYEK